MSARTSAAAIIERWGKMTTVEIGAEVGLSASAVRAIGKGLALGAPKIKSQIGKIVTGSFWTPERRQAAEAGWKAGQSAEDIAHRIGSTKNAVLSLAHRSGWDGRPSPIKPRDPNQPVRVRNPSKPKPDDTTRQRATGELIGFTLPGVKQEPTPRVIATGPVGECQWLPMERRPWVACCAPSVPGKSWCPKHYAVVYQPHRERDAA